ncbi:hypothetical protein ACFLXD_03900 [Chloroflexota bacterium]
MSSKDEYRRKLISAKEAAGLVKSGMWNGYGAICGFPSLTDEELAKRADELEEAARKVNLITTGTAKLSYNDEYIH